MSHLTFDDYHYLESLRVYFKRQASRIYDEMFGSNTQAFAGAKIALEGTIYRDMYDEAPGHTFFTKPHQVELAEFDLMTRDQIRDAALSALAERTYRPSNEGDLFDGLFCPDRVVIYDSKDRIIDLYEKGRWFDQWIPEAEWSLCFQRIQRLMKLAAEEVGQDNFDASRRHREAASRLGRHLDLSRLYATQSIQYPSNTQRNRL